MRVWFVVFLICFPVSTNPGPSSRNPDLTPDYTSEAYWQANSIYVVRMLDVAPLEMQQVMEWVKGPQGEKQIRPRIVPNPYKMQYVLETVRAFTPDQVDERQTVQTSDLWFGMSMGTVRPDPPLAKGDLILVSAEKLRPKDRTLLVCKKLDIPMDESSLIKALAAISEIRSQNDKGAALRKGLLHADPQVVRYYVNTLADKDAKITDKALVSQILKIRFDDDFPMTARLNAARLYEASFEKPRSASEKVAWMKEIFRNPAKLDGYQLGFLGQALVSAGERQDVAEFLIKLAKDDDAFEPARGAAVTLLAEPPCFTPDNPNDLVSGHIFDTLLNLIKHRTVGIRMTAAQGLANICNAVKNEPKHKPIIGKVEAALRGAIKAETDPNIARDLRRLHYPVECLLDEEE